MSSTLPDTAVWVLITHYGSVVGGDFSIDRELCLHMLEKPFYLAVSALIRDGAGGSLS